MSKSTTTSLLDECSNATVDCSAHQLQIASRRMSAYLAKVQNLKVVPHRCCLSRSADVWWLLLIFRTPAAGEAAPERATID